MEASGVNYIGLVLDIIGAILLYKYGLPESIDRYGHIHLIVEESDEVNARQESPALGFF
jgi:hypothetical protein